MKRLDMSSEAMRRYYRGRVFEATGEIDVAIEEYRKALELGADYADIHNSLGRAYVQKGLLAEARAEFKKALQINPYYLEAQKNMNEVERRLSISEEKEQIKIPARKTKVKHYPLVIIAAIPIVLVVFFVLYFLTKTSIPVIGIYALPSGDISSIFSTGKEIWLSDWLKQEMYCCKVEDGNLKTIKKYPLSNICPVGIFVSEGYLWTADAWSRKINKHIFDDKLSVISSYDFLQGSLDGLCSDKKAIYTCSGNRIYKHNPDQNLTIEKYIATPATELSGIFFDGKNYFSIDAKKHKIYKHMKKDLSIISEYDLDIGDKKIVVSCIDRKFIWLIFESENQIYCYPKNKFLH